MSSKLGKFLLRKAIWMPGLPVDGPLLPSAPATLHAKAEVTLADADRQPYLQPRAVLSFTVTAKDELSASDTHDLARKEVIRVLRAMADAIETSLDSRQDVRKPHSRSSSTSRR